MPDGGSIDIKVYRYDGKKRTFSSVFSRDRDSSDRVIIEIRDYGTGIEESNLNKVFIPFFTTKKSGTGLGLAISKKIIESHNGKLEINSKKGEGTTVRVILPVLLDTEVKR
jgi:signal transduction histidine kinase